jgi:hypothetical protein
LHHRRLTGPVTGADVKVAWEASRMHWLTALARANAYRPERRHVDGAVDLLASWCAANPPGWGVNWSNAMEAGIRAANLAWAAEIFDDPLISVLVGGLLRSHGRYIVANLEYSPHLTSNHFLADVVGLLHIGALLRHSAEGRAYLRLASRLFAREIPKQFNTDGVNFEASTAYHRLSTELLLLGVVVHRQLGLSVPDVVHARLASALTALEVLTGPSGRFPPMGDDDSGLIVNLSSGRDHRDPRPLLEAGRALCASGERPRTEMAQWLTAVGSVDEPAPGADQLAGSGLIVLVNDRIWCLVEAGGVGQRGNGGHAHNDTLSFVLEANGREVVVDPGTLGYTRDPDARNTFRATRVHATVEVDQEEINRIDKQLLFTMGNDDSPRIEHIEIAKGSVRRVVASHRGYWRLADPVTHRRTWSLEPDGVVISDELECHGAHEALVSFPLAPEVAPEATPGGWLLRLTGVDVHLSQVSGPEIALTPEPLEVSPRYGTRQESRVLRGHFSLRGNTRWSFRIAVLSANET